MKQRIMRRVTFIWFSRRVLPFLLLEILTVWFATVKIAEYVFVNQVFYNATIHTLSRSPFMMINFFFRAFMNTEMLVQLLIAASCIGGSLIMRDLLRSSRALTQQIGTFMRIPRVI
jgi:hypothetical protein